MLFIYCEYNSRHTGIVIICASCFHFLEEIFGGAEVFNFDGAGFADSWDIVRLLNSLLSLFLVAHKNEMTRPCCLKAPYAVVPGHGEIKMALKWTLPSRQLVLLSRLQGRGRNATISLTRR